MSYKELIEEMLQVFDYRGYMIIRVSNNKFSVNYKNKNGGRRLSIQPTKQDAKEFIDQLVDFD